MTLNDFQKRVEERLNVAFKDLGLAVDSRRIFREKVPFLSRDSEIVVDIRVRDFEVGIREHSASFTLSGKGHYYEMPDYPNADALADALLKELTKEVAPAATNVVED